MARLIVLALVACWAGLACGAGDDDADTDAPTTASAAGAATGSTGSGTTAPDVAEPALRGELLATLVEDQAVRTGVPPPGDDRTPEELLAAMSRVDAEHSARMEQILDTHGCPTWSLVGRDGSTAAWALVQHADLRPELQRRGPDLLAQAVAAGDASPGELADLTDRVRVADGQPQVYGTQWETDVMGSLVPRAPIEDSDTVDARRAEAGLATIDEHLDELRTSFAAVPTIPEPTGG